MKLKSLLALVVLGAAAGAAAYRAGLLPDMATLAPSAEPQPAAQAKSPAEPSAEAAAPAVTVAEVKEIDFIDTVLATGSLVAREEILVAPEVEGLKLVELRADEGDRVKKGDVLAVLVSETLDAQVAQSNAALARADAVIARAKSQIVEVEARVAEADAALERARPLVKSDYLSASVFDQREAAARTARAQLTAAKDGLVLAEAEKAQAEAQRRELDWRHSNTEVRAPADGIVSARGARIGAIAIGAFVAGSGDPLFRIIENGEIELDAEVPETRLPKIAVGQPATAEPAGSEPVTGKVRLVSPVVNKSTRLGRVRIFLGDNPALKIGTFARASIETEKKRGLAVPRSAILYGEAGPVVLAVVNDQVQEKRVTTGLSATGMIEIVSGVAKGDIVVAKAGTFLRDGDRVRPINPGTAVSEAD